MMYHQRIVLYGNLTAQEKARDLLQRLDAVRHESCVLHRNEIRLTLTEPLKEISLIPLLRQSGIHGFRLIES